MAGILEGAEQGWDEGLGGQALAVQAQCWESRCGTVVGLWDLLIAMPEVFTSLSLPTSCGCLKLEAF